MEETVTDLRKVALNDLHISLGAKMVPFAGFYMPLKYISELEEHHTVRNSAGVFDVSHMGEFLIRGTKALDLIQRVTSNDASLLSPGKIQYSCLPNDKGGIVDDLLVYKLAEEEYMLVVNASNIDKDWAWISRQNKAGAEMENISDRISLFAVQGPKAPAIVQKLTSADISCLNYYTFTRSVFAGAENVIISATGYTGEPGYEIYVENRFAESVWKKIFEAGAEFGIKPIGLGARDTLRLEMGYCLYGNDIDDSTSPIEAGLSWITKFKKEFINRENLLSQKEKGSARKLAGFEMIDKGIPRSHYEIVNEKEELIGTVTSGTQSPSLGKGIGMGYVSASYAEPGKEIFIRIRNKSLKARVVTLPFYKKK